MSTLSFSRAKSETVYFLVIDRKILAKQLEWDVAERVELEEKAAYVAGFQKPLPCQIMGSYACCAASR
jgi:hypothetical protein